MRRAGLLALLGLPLVFAALPLASLLFTNAGSSSGPDTVVRVTETITVAPVTAEPDPLAMQADPGRDCSHVSPSRIDS